MIPEVASLGSIVILAAVAPPYFDNRAALAQIGDAQGVVTLLAGAVAAGTAITVVTRILSEWSRLYDLTETKPAHVRYVGWRGRLAVLYPTTLATARKLTQSAERQADLTTHYEFQRQAREGVRAWVKERYDDAASAVNVAVAVVVGLAAGFLIFGGGSNLAVELTFLAGAGGMLYGGWRSYTLARHMEELQLRLAATEEPEPDPVDFYFRKSRGSSASGGAGIPGSTSAPDPRRSPAGTAPTRAGRVPRSPRPPSTPGS